MRTIEQILKTINHRNSLKDITIKDSLRPLEDWETDKKCLRSIFNIGSHGLISRLRKKKKINSNFAFGSTVINKKDTPQSEIDLGDISQR